MIHQKSAILLINTTNTNILFVLTSLEGQILLSISTGKFKTKGAKKVTLTTIKLCFLQLNQALSQRFKIHIKFKGFSKHKRLLLKLFTKNINYPILSFCDTKAVPHNGVKSSKVRRV